MTLGNKGWECSLREWAEVHAGAGGCSLRERAGVHLGAWGCSLRERAGVHLGAGGCSLRERAGVHLGAEKVSFAWRVGEFQLRLCRRPTRGRQSPRPLDPGLRPASPPLRGPFASSGFLTDRRDAPSLARTRLFAASLPLVLKSLIRSAALTASFPALSLLFVLVTSSL